MMKIAIASGKGGTGKTFVSTNLYQLMVKEGKHVGLVDCDAEVPNDFLFLPGQQLDQWSVNVFCPTIAVDRCLHCGKCAESCHYHAITSIPALRYIKVMEELCHACTACLYACDAGAVVAGEKELGQVTAYGHESLPQLFEARIKAGEHSPVPVITEAIRRAEQAHFDYLILDAPPGCACPFVSTVKSADLVFLVTEPTPFGLSDLKQTIVVLRQMKKNFQVIINRADLGDDELKNFLATEHIAVALELPYSKDIATTYSQGDLAVLKLPQFYHLFTDLNKIVLQYEDSCR